MGKIIAILSASGGNETIVLGVKLAEAIREATGRPAGLMLSGPRGNEVLEVLTGAATSDMNQESAFDIEISPEFPRGSANDGIPDVLLFIVKPDFLSLKQAAIKLDEFNEFHFPRERVKLILDGTDELCPVPVETVERYLKAGISRRYPSDAAGVTALARELAEFCENSPGTRHESDHAELDLAVLRESIHKKIISELNVSPAARESVRKIINDSLAEVPESSLTREERPLFVKSLLDDVLGLGCLEEFLEDPAVTEVMVNGAGSIYVEEKGKLRLTDKVFDSNTRLMTVIDRIVSPLGRRIDESSPIVDARLSDGSRVNAVIPPLSLNGPVLTIRKFSKNKLTAEDLIAFGALSGAMAAFIGVCVHLRKNIVVSGGTGSGKTTLLNTISSFIPPGERIITIEDSAELRLGQKHVIRLESRPASVEGTGEIPIRRLVINALRMRPDRIIVGECRGGEALDMLQAMNTGHDGSMTTVHANSPRDAVARICTMAMMSGVELPERAVMEQVASAINIIIQLSRFSDGSRKVTRISEITGIKNGAVGLTSLFEYRQEGIVDGKVNGGFHSEGNLPTFFEDIGTRGLALDLKIFSGDIK
jgi:pilus assembly protein CpaF